MGWFGEWGVYHGHGFAHPCEMDVIVCVVRSGHVWVTRTTSLGFRGTQVCTGLQ